MRLSPGSMRCAFRRTRQMHTPISRRRTLCPSPRRRTRPSTTLRTFSSSYASTAASQSPDDGEIHFNLATVLEACMLCLLTQVSNLNPRSRRIRRQRIVALLYVQHDSRSVRTKTSGTAWPNSCRRALTLSVRKSRWQRRGPRTPRKTSSLHVQGIGVFFKLSLACQRTSASSITCNCSTILLFTRTCVSSRSIIIHGIRSSMARIICLTATSLR